MTRTEGWELRLQAVVEAARHQPYRLGTHDCFRLACAVVLALTGCVLPDVGVYATRREALVRIARWGGTFESAFDAYFGSPHVAVLQARRGDLVAYQDAGGEKHLAVCMGGQCAALGEAGIAFVPLRAGLCAWRIG